MMSLVNGVTSNWPRTTPASLNRWLLHFYTFAAVPADKHLHRVPAREAIHMAAVRALGCRNIDIPLRRDVLDDLFQDRGAHRSEDIAALVTDQRGSLAPDINHNAAATLPVGSCAMVGKRSARLGIEALSRRFEEKLHFGY